MVANEELIEQVTRKNKDMQDCRDVISYLGCLEDDRRLDRRGRRLRATFEDKLILLEEERNLTVALNMMKLDGELAWKKTENFNRSTKSFFLAGIMQSRWFVEMLRWPSRTDRHEGDIGCYNRKYPCVPFRLRLDCDLILAYIEHAPTCRLQEFILPESLHNNDLILKAWIRKCPGVAFRFASARLRDDGNFVLSLLDDKYWGSFRWMKKISDRLKNSMPFFLKAVKSEQETLQFASEALKSSHEFVTKLLVDVGLSSVEHLSANLLADKALMLTFVAKNGFNLRYLSDELKSDEEVGRAAVLNCSFAFPYYQGKNIHEDRELMLPLIEKREVRLEQVAPSIRAEVLSNRKDGDFVLKAFQNWEESADEVDHYFTDFEIPEELYLNPSFLHDACALHPYATYMTLPDTFKSNNREVALSVFQAFHTKEESAWYLAFEILKHVPSLVDNREIILQSITDDTIEFSLGLIIEGGYEDDRSVMLKACANGVQAIDYVSSRLKGDRDFLLAIIEEDWYGGEVLNVLSGTFQRANADIVIRCIKACQDEDEMFPNVKAWGNRDVVEAWLHKGHNLLRRSIPRGRRSIVWDIELVHLAARYEWRKILASPSSFDDQQYDAHPFLRELVRASLSTAADRDPRGLLKQQCSWRELWIPVIASDILAIAKYKDAYFCDNNECDHLTFFDGVAKEVRSKLELYDGFFAFLCGIAISRENTAPRERCILKCLDRDHETSTSIKRLIAEYCGVPMGPELLTLRKASTNLLAMCI